MHLKISIVNLLKEKDINMLVDVSALNPILFLSVLLFTFVFSLTFYNKYLWNIIDPFIFLLFNIAMNASIVFYFYFMENIKLEIVGLVLASFISFLIGLKVASKFSKKYYKHKKEIVLGPSKQFAIYLLFVAISLKSIFLLFLVSKTGLGLITGDVHPDIKLMIFLDGGGVFKYVDWAGSSLLIPLLFYFYYILKNKFYFILGFLFFLSYNLIFPTSKAGMITLVFQFGLSAFYIKYVLNQNINIKKISFFIILIGLIPAITVLSRYSTDIFSFFIVRLIDTGGGTYNYFIQNGLNAFVNYSFIDTINNYFDTFLSVFRIKAWEDPNRMAALREYIIGSYQHGYGQNPFLFLDGHFLFGYFGFIYTFFVGLILGFVRFMKIDFVSFHLLIFSLISLVSDPDIVQAKFVSYILILLAVSIFALLRLLTKNKFTLPVIILRKENS